MITIHKTLGQLWHDYVPSFTGFSSNPSSVVARYTLNGKTCSVYFFAISGTSNATTFTITLPIAAANTQVQTFNAGNTQDNGVSASSGVVRTVVNSNVLNVYKTNVGGAFTASGSKNVAFCITYETV
jgi:hypothetical protein